MTAKNGGPAFARPWSLDTRGDYPMEVSAQEGMTLRDYMAAKAMQGLCAYPGKDKGTELDMAKISYHIADAMLAEREK